LARHKRIKAIADKVITKGLILGFYTPLALYIYASVIYDGAKQYNRHMRNNK
jgi:hypothetical protein